MWHASRIVLLAAGLGFLLPAQQTGSHISEEKAAAIGAKLASDVRSQTDVLRIAVVDKYIARLGERLGAEIQSGSMPWKFEIVRQAGDWSHEPLGLPGQYVFVPAALVVSAEDESELAVMLAHAMVHSLRPLMVPPSLASIPLSFVIEDLGLRGERNSLIPLSLRSAEQDREVQADETAMQAASAAGFDPTALPAYLERLQRTAAFRSTAEMEIGTARLNKLRQAPETFTQHEERRPSSALFLLVQEEVRQQGRREEPRAPSLLTPSRSR